MTQKSFTKMLKQLDNKPGKKVKYLKHNATKDRTCGLAKSCCVTCGKHRGVINKYKISMCRQCFREHAFDLGFKKYH